MEITAKGNLSYFEPYVLTGAHFTAKGDLVNSTAILAHVSGSATKPPALHYPSLFKVAFIIGTPFPAFQNYTLKIIMLWRQPLDSLLSIYNKHDLPMPIAARILVVA